MICTFFGHKDCSNSIKPKLIKIIKEQIKLGTTCFYVGNHGNFDTLALSCLRELKKEYKELCYSVVLAYLPTDSNAYLQEETIFPEGIEQIPKRFAIDFRNRWLINHADTVITYVSHSWGGAAKYTKKAKNKSARYFACCSAR